MPQTIARRKDLTSEQEQTYWIFWSAPKCVFFSQEPLIRLSAGISGHKVNCRNSTCLQKRGDLDRLIRECIEDWGRQAKSSVILAFNDVLMFYTQKTSNQGLYNIFFAFSLVENLFSICNFDQERTIFFDSQNQVKDATLDIIFVLLEKNWACLRLLF